MNAAHGRDGDGMRVVVQNGEYWLQNNGDLAMLDVTVGRLRGRWPRARIGVLTSAPSLLRAYLPGVVPLSDGRLTEFAAPLWRAAEVAGPALVGPLSNAWLESRQRLQERLARRPAPRPAPVAPDVEGPGVAGPEELPVPPDVLAEVERASLVLAIGGGYLTDVDPYQVRRTFGILEAATAARVPSALVGQGLGPLTDPGLLAAAARVLPGVDAIALREGRRGPALLDRIGVPAAKVTVTGDDAIELAAGVRTDEIGAGIGVCLRVAEYSPVGRRAIAEVGSAVRAVAARRGAPLVSLIISEWRSEDRRSTLPLLAGAERVVPPLGPHVGARMVAQRAGRCRVVVTGAYHLAVFALSQGIPVVGLTSSEYYDDKFLGLIGMFEGGVRLVHLDGTGLVDTLAKEIDAAWDEAPEVRAPLRARADSQIAASRAVLDRVLSLAEARVPRRLHA